ncbi:MAG: hypothetical protein LUD55_08715 [Oscillospiraceae bacterium]|nr:hypothetical protein [Oscillospiraceae bacterium]
MKNGKAKYIIAAIVLIVFIAAALFAVSRWESATQTAAPTSAPATETETPAATAAPVEETDAPRETEQPAATDEPAETAEPDADAEPSETDATEATTADDDPAAVLVAACRADLEALASEFESRTSSLIAAYRERWLAIPEDERNDDRKLDLGAEAMDEISALESEVDSRVSLVLSTYRETLEAISADTAPCDEMYQEYLDRKAAAVSYYSSIYG